METILKPEYKFQITRFLNGHITAILFDATESMTVGAYDVEPRDITTPHDITTEINRVWDAIPAEYKRTDILK
jgi:hypothetical protein